jgi:hypothetical protein
VLPQIYYKEYTIEQQHIGEPNQHSEPQYVSTSELRNTIAKSLLCFTNQYSASNLNTQNNPQLFNNNNYNNTNGFDNDVNIDMSSSMQSHKLPIGVLLQEACNKQNNTNSNTNENDSNWLKRKNFDKINTNMNEEFLNNTSINYGNNISSSESKAAKVIKLDSSNNKIKANQNMINNRKEDSNGNEYDNEEDDDEDDGENEEDEEDDDDDIIEEDNDDEYDDEEYDDEPMEDDNAEDIDEEIDEDQEVRSVYFHVKNKIF